jgi:hypothetical protein
MSAMPGAFIFERGFHTKAQSRATKAQRRSVLFETFAPLWLGFVPLCEIILSFR